MSDHNASSSMSTLAQATANAFVEDGALARQDAYFRPRFGQTQMAVAVANAIDNQDVLVVEAGTGVGKTFAYLVPALLCGKKILLSTATKTLQDQLFEKDLPHLCKTLGLPVQMALLKGRSNYLCVQRLETASHQIAPSEKELLSQLVHVQKWAKQTKSGDLNELIGLGEKSPLLPYVTSNKDNCLGGYCPEAANCHVNLARKMALEADVLVVNHHLFFADLAVRESGVTQLLPNAQVVVFDEAHQLNEIGVQFFGTQLGTHTVLDLVRDVTMLAGTQARSLADWAGINQLMEHAVNNLKLAVGRIVRQTGDGAQKISWSLGETAPQGIESPKLWHTSLQNLHQSAARLQKALDAVKALSPDMAKLTERAQELVAQCGSFLQTTTTPNVIKTTNTVNAIYDKVRWVEIGIGEYHHLNMVESPLDIAASVQRKMLKSTLLTNEPVIVQTDVDVAHHERKSWIFTSATLGNDAQLSWFTEPCGLTNSTVLQVESPFDYTKQACLYIPSHLPQPNDPQHSTTLAKWLIPSIKILDGRTLILTTTLRAVQTIGTVLRDRLPREMVVLIQGQFPKTELLKRFKILNQIQEESTSNTKQKTAKNTQIHADTNVDVKKAGCVLVASASFWEGIDIPGSELVLVVIDKLPFPPPTDPMVEARSQRLQQQHRNPFADYSLPEVCISLKQGAGRLIRRETDRGILVIGDPRLGQKSYGKRILRTLPPMKQLHSETDFESAISNVSNSLAFNENSHAIAHLD